jgi:conjugal transfer pilus assembly protein TraW
MMRPHHHPFYLGQLLQSNDLRFLLDRGLRLTLRRHLQTCSLIWLPLRAFFQELRGFLVQKVQTSVFLNLRVFLFNTLFKGSVHILLWMPLLCGEACAKDLGVHGATLEIGEKNLLEVIQTKLQHLSATGQLKTLQKDIQKKVSEKAQNPTRVTRVRKTTHPRRYHFDPTLTIDHDIKDHQGEIIHRKGTRINPLETLSWGEPLVFLDGEDAEHIVWTLKHYPSAKHVLIGGKPLDLSNTHSVNTHNVRFYFDQGGALIKKFKIQQVPAVVIQDGKRLLIEEILVKGPSR